ncbi:MAG: hypothetical protein L0154_22715 [Chloroflexi bacterium]|nr:hypothetical protein [Chloroflexota bacterium]
MAGYHGKIVGARNLLEDVDQFQRGHDDFAPLHIQPSALHANNRGECAVVGKQVIAKGELAEVIAQAADAEIDAEVLVNVQFAEIATFFAEGNRANVMVVKILNGEPQFVPDVKPGLHRVFHVRDVFHVLVAVQIGPADNILPAKIHQTPIREKRDPG